MADVFDLDADVFFGDPDAPLPNWRETDEDESDEDAPQPGVAGMLGFDPAELADEPEKYEGGADPEDSERHRVDVPEKPLNDAPADEGDLTTTLAAAFEKRGFLR